MTLDEAAAHLGNPVLIRTGPGRVTDAEITDVRGGLVHVRVRRKQAPYDWLPGMQWWHPAHLSVPQWWLDRLARQAQEELVVARHVAAIELAEIDAALEEH